MRRVGGGVRKQQRKAGSDDEKGSGCLIRGRTSEENRKRTSCLKVDAHGQAQRK